MPTIIKLMICAIVTKRKVVFCLSYRASYHIYINDTLYLAIYRKLLPKISRRVVCETKSEINCCFNADINITYLASISLFGIK